ncbi:hypothetical protein NLI96_g1083 [Meripilus lineatus]|uniref:Dynamitin n=1 Tax=Meripilus lineatus TaxID=2056292 RepID=A0AAD5VGP6_9APHY|nr:hypothetical protein NLI96_g1083 [Physisporinus lineatus]
MSANKYAGLPDIDTAPDVYETEDVVETSIDDKAESSDEETGGPSRSHGRKNVEGPSKEEMDTSSLLTADEASKKFRRAERRQHRPRIVYAYPPSPTSSGQASPVSSTPALPLSQRLRRLQAELAVLETEMADPSNPLLHKERVEGNLDPGELIRGMVDVKGRLEKISKVKEGRGRLVSAILEDGADGSNVEKKTDGDKEVGEKASEGDSQSKGEVKDIAEMDRRVGELEKLSPLPPPLLPLLTRLNTQLALLTQPRHLDSISRRLKVLLTDLDRVSNSNTQHHSSSQRRQSNHHHPPNASPQSGSSSGPPQHLVSPLQEQLTPVLTRLAPLLPHIPHILARLRTLSALHTSAAGFQNTLENLEEEQRRTRAALVELQSAIEGVEQSLKDNEGVVKNNVKELEERVETINERMEQLSLARGAEYEPEELTV